MASKGGRNAVTWSTDSGADQGEVFVAVGHSLSGLWCQGELQWLLGWEAKKHKRNTHTKHCIAGRDIEYSTYCI